MPEMLQSLCRYLSKKVVFIKIEKKTKHHTFHLQESFPLWFRAVHVVNAPSLFHFAYNVVKPLLSKTVRESIVFHKELSGLHAHVDKEILPEEFGGSAEDFDNEECLEALEGMDEVFQEFKALTLS